MAITINDYKKEHIKNKEDIVEINSRLADKQNKNDSTLTTANKTITGAINENTTKLAEILKYPAAKAYLTTAQSIANNTAGILYMNGVFFDSDNIYNSTSANRLTAKTAGLYDIKAFVTFAINSTGSRMVRISRNGSGENNAIRQVFTASVAGEVTNVYANTLYKLNAGDFIIIEVLQNSGASLNILNATFEMVKVG